MSIFLRYHFSVIYNVLCAFCAAKCVSDLKMHNKCTCGLSGVLTALPSVAGLRQRDMEEAEKTRREKVGSK